MINQITCGDCLEVMKDIPAGSVDMVLCDLPYGVIDCKWDERLPFSELWKEYLRVAKENAALVFTAKGLFMVDLIQSQRKLYRYSLIWEKTVAMGFLNAHKMPLQNHEEICVFYRRLPTYNPQFTEGKPYTRVREVDSPRFEGYHANKRHVTESTGQRYPKSVLRFSNGNYQSKHPTQKPVPLFEWLIKTYTNPGEVVLDSCIGSGTTAVAALKTGRRFIGIEANPEFCKVAESRIKEIE